jgi:myo-inositol-1(or 4)-monophosphatase
MPNGGSRPTATEERSNVDSTFDAADLHRFQTVAEHAAEVGSRVVARAAGRPREAGRLKGHGDYVSDVDRDSEAAIRGFLSSATPDVPVVAEEGGGEGGDVSWVVDPLDGTTNFLIGFPVVSVAVALVAGGRVMAGAIRAPLLDLAFSAARGQGAWSGSNRLHVSDRQPARAIVAMALPFRVRSLGPRYLRMLEEVFGVTEDVRRAGSAELELAWAAAGVWDGYFELHLSPWDLAAGSLLVEEAGGVVTDWSGGPRYLERGDVLAGSPQTHAVLLDAAKRTESGVAD